MVRTSGRRRDDAALPRWARDGEGTRVLGVYGVSGGVGASTLAVALAVRAAAAGVRVVCIDGRPFGCPLDVIGGVEHEPGLRWSQLAGIRGEVDGEALLAQLPSCQGSAVLAHDRVSAAAIARADGVGGVGGTCGVGSVAGADGVDGASRDADGSSAIPSGVITTVVGALTQCVDLVVIDLDRVTGWGAPCWAALDEVIVVAAGSLPSLAALSMIASVLDERTPMASIVLSGADGQEVGSALSHSVEECVDLPVRAVVPFDRRVIGDLHRGQPPGDSDSAYRRAVDHLLAELLVAGRAA